jgi:NAD-dependent SIR2 family protein deacetylase
MLRRTCLISKHQTSSFLTVSTSNSRAMSQATPKQFASDEKLKGFQRHLQSSDRILALLGAGLSASSGLPTFRGAGGMWKNHQATSLATSQAFRHDPGLVWQFYSYRRHMALQAKPNPAHYALAELARQKPNFITLSQNVDGESALTKIQSFFSIIYPAHYSLSYAQFVMPFYYPDPGHVQ